MPPQRQPYGPANPVHFGPRLGGSNTRKVRKSLIISGYVPDKSQLIRIASAETKRAFPVEGNVNVIDAGPFNPKINGYQVVVDFQVKGRGVVATKKRSTWRSQYISTGNVRLTLRFTNAKW
jgi:hypothetical protein